MVTRQRRHQGPTAAIVVVVALVLLVAVAAWWFLRSPGTPSSDIAGQSERPASVQAPATLAPDAPALELPELSASDQFIRNLVAGLSARPELARWLASDDLVYGFVGAVVDVAGSRSPAGNLPFLVPEEPFRVRETSGGIFIDPEGFRRYDPLTQTFIALDTRGTARLYAQLHPLFDEAYADLGIPDSTFDDAMALAMGNVLSVEVPEGEFRVIGSTGFYEYVDAELEDRTPLEGHMLRMGPQNARLVQAKVQELADALGIEPREG